MEPDLLEEARRWLKQAKSDFSFLPIAIQARKYDVTCFLSQQAAEKAIKAYLFSKGEEAIFTHSIFKLCELASTYDKDFYRLKDEIKNLDLFYSETRYPDAINDVIPAEFFNESDAGEALGMAEKALKLVEEKIPAENK